MGAVNTVGSTNPASMLPPSLAVGYGLCAYPPLLQNSTPSWPLDPIQQSCRITNQTNAFPLATIILNAATTQSLLDSNWMVANGTVLLRAEYSDLFNLLGSTFAGNGVTDFGLPSLTARFPQGHTTIGNSFGAESVRRSSFEFPFNCPSDIIPNAAPFSSVENSPR